MDSWILTAQEAVRRSPVVCEELRTEAERMLRDGEDDTARRIFVDILEEPMSDIVSTTVADCIRLN